MLFRKRYVHVFCLHVCVYMQIFAVLLCRFAGSEWSHSRLPPTSSCRRQLAVEVSRWGQVWDSCRGAPLYAHAFPLRWSPPHTPQALTFHTGVRPRPVAPQRPAGARAGWSGGRRRASREAPAPTSGCWWDLTAPGPSGRPSPSWAWWLHSI